MVVDLDNVRARAAAADWTQREFLVAMLTQAADITPRTAYIISQAILDHPDFVFAFFAEEGVLTPMPPEEDDDTWGL